jgi:RND family efflux transporter MFP subunit
MEARQFFLEEWTEILGTTQPLPDRAARITAPVEGRVASVLRDAHGQPLAEGSLVKKGDVIVRLDDGVARANRAKMAATLEESKQHAKQAEYAVKLAEIDVRRLKELNAGTGTSGGIGTLALVSRIEQEKAQVVLDEARSKQKAAELGHLAVEQELQALDEQLKLYTLTAPITGRLGRILVVQGQTITPGAPVADVVDLGEEIDLLCFVPPRVARKLKEGQAARVGGTDDTAPGKVAAEGQDTAEGDGKKPANPEGKIVFIADQAETDTGNFAVKVRFPNKDLGLRGNTTLRLRVQTNPGKACLTLPESAVMEDQDPPTVIVVEDYKQETNKDGKEEETGKARKLRVKLGLRDRTLHLVEIVSLDDPEKKWQGTLDTAKFVVERGQGLRNGDAMKLEVDED